MTRSTIFFLLAVYVVCDCLVGAERPPNLVWIIADDMSPDLACYGASGVRTPNLDRLAAQGRRFTRAYASAPVCSSSRSAFILGCYQTTTGLHAHDVENPQPLSAPYIPLPTLLRQAGWFVTNSPAPGSVRSGRAVKKAKTHYNFAHDYADLFDGDDWRKRAPGQPFFAQFQITEPHRPFPIPETFPDVAVNAISLPANYPDHPLMKRDWYAYLKSVETVDRRVGEILEQLEAEGVLENTIVMFFADHGRPMPWGKQWLTVEGLHVPLLMRGPGIATHGLEMRLVSLIDLAPTVLSIAKLPIPSWMEGKPILGDDFPRRDFIFAARDRCGDAHDRIRAAIGIDVWFVKNFYPKLSRSNWSSYREESYPGMPLLRALQESGKLTVAQSNWLAPTRAEFELYDLRTDPLGLKNLAGGADQAQRVADLHTILSEWIHSTSDRGFLPDPPTEPTLAEIQKDKRAGYEKTWQSRIKKSEPTDNERVAWWLNRYGL